MAVAFIFDGYTDGSTLVKVQADAVEGTDVFVCDDSNQSVLGTGELLGGEVSITVSPALAEGQRIIAYLTSVGYYTMGGITVLPSGELHTGWEKPVTVEVDEVQIPVEEYEADTDTQVPDVYNPEAVNRVAEMESTFFEKIPAQVIAFNLRIDRNYGTTTVTVEDVTGALSGFLIQFDGDEPSNIDAKNYTVNGTYEVKVIDAEDDTRFTTVSFTVTSTSPPPEDSEISNASYVQDGVNVTLIADSTLALEGKIDGVSGSFADMVLVGGKRWVSGTYVVPGAGAYTMRVRVKTDTPDEIVISSTIY